MESTATWLQKQINAAEAGRVLLFADLAKESRNPRALAIALSRLAKRGEIVRLGKGRYCKPKKTAFGTVLASDAEVLKSMLKPSRRGGMPGYVSGTAAYNKLGLTHQIPNEVVIVGRSSTRKSSIGKLKVRFLSRSVTINEQTKDLLPILDALRDIKRIPGTSVEDALSKITQLVGALPEDRLDRLVALAFAYRPRVRALLGAILDETGRSDLSARLRAKLNPLSFYKIEGASKVLAGASSWSIR